MGNDKRRIASLALFRNLYNEGRSDIMKILCEFAKHVIYSKRLTEFTPTEIKNELKSEYEFYIPEYVVESVIKKFCRKENSYYSPNEGNVSKEVNSKELERIEQSHNIIFSRLIAFIENKAEKKLSETEKEKLFQSFCKYIIEESDVDFSEYISTFIIEAKNDIELSNLIQTIKEGVILYTGLQYNEAINEIGSWKDDFTIYVEQEILFHLAGYNGTLYQQLYFDFRDLIKEINRKAGKHLIKIKYFDSVKNEIDRFFKIAERIVDGKETLNCSNVAMTDIVRGCEHKSDIVEKRAKFYEILKREQIEEESNNLFTCHASEYNIDYEENIEQISKDLPERDVHWSLSLLNYTNLVRKCKMHSFEKSKCILLTGNSTTMAVAFHPLIKQNGEVPLATTLDYITNKLWFKMNKGFGSSAYPKSFSIITKAQIVLSTQIIGSVSKEFEKIKKEIIDKSKPESVIVAELAELKARVRKPEEVHETDIDEILSTISMADTEQYLREREMERIEAEEQKKENKRLKSEIEESKNNIRQQVEEKNFYKGFLATHIGEQINEIEEKKRIADIRINKHMRRVQWIPWTIIIVYVIIIIYLINMYGWDKMEFYTWLITIIVASIPYILFALNFSSFNPQDMINVIYKKYYQNKIYRKENIDLSKLESLKEQKSLVENRVSCF